MNFASTTNTDATMLPKQMLAHIYLYTENPINGSNYIVC